MCLTFVSLHLRHCLSPSVCCRADRGAVSRCLCQRTQRVAEMREVLVAAERDSHCTLSLSLSLSFPFLFAAAVFALLHPLILFFLALSPPLVGLSKHSRLIRLLHISLSPNLPCFLFFYFLLFLCFLQPNPPEQSQTQTRDVVEIFLSEERKYFCSRLTVRCLIVIQEKV